MAVDTWISLFRSGGDTTVDTPDLWNGDLDPYTTETDAVADEGTAGNYARISYSGGLAPGTYYIRVRGVQSVQNGAYALRVLKTPADSPTGPGWARYFSGANPSEVRPLGGFYGTDDSPLQGGVPPNAAPISRGEKLNRWLTAGHIAAHTPGDVDWFRLILP
jgi:hypothetical protein